MPVVKVFSPADLQADPTLLAEFNLQFLAQGDSWFSFGAVPPPATTNVFDRMSLPVAAGVINCASPGLVLRRMTDTTHASVFLRLLNGALQRPWSGVLISGGGNDLIEAAQAGPQHPPALRLLATQAEWRPLPGGERYLSEAGWATFATHLAAVFDDLVAARDRGQAAGAPIVVHTYDLATPRDCGAGLGVGPWLFPAMQAFGIPQADWAAVAAALLSRLADLLRRIAQADPARNLHVVDTQGVLQPAQPTDTGPTAHWENEIHPSKAGYRLLNRRWTPVVGGLFAPGLAGLLAPAGSAAVKPARRRRTPGAAAGASTASTGRPALPVAPMAGTEAAAAAATDAPAPPLH